MLGQTSLLQRLGGQADLRGPTNYNQPDETFKLQYSNNLNATTFITTKFYRVDNTALFDFPQAGNGIYGSDQVSLQGGQRVGFALDGTKQLGSKNLLGFGGKFDFLRPVYSQPSASTALFANSTDFFPGSQGYNILDFLPNDANCPVAPACGYLLGQRPGQTPGTPFRGNSIGKPITRTHACRRSAPTIAVRSRRRCSCRTRTSRRTRSVRTSRSTSRTRSRRRIASRSTSGFGSTA